MKLAILLVALCAAHERSQQATLSLDTPKIGANATVTVAPSKRLLGSKETLEAMVKVGGMVTIPVSRRKRDPTVHRRTKYRVAKRAINDHDKKLLMAHGVAKTKMGQEVQIVLRNMYDTQYFAEIQVGTPSKKYEVVLDTGSSDSWLLSTKTRSEFAEGGTQGEHEYYSSADSSSFHPDSCFQTKFELEYISGACSGEYVKDTLSVAGQSVPKYGFAEVDYFDEGLRRILDFDGVFGLAFQELIEEGKCATPIWTHFLKPVFSFRLKSNDDGQPSRVTMGGTLLDDDQVAYGKVTWTPVVTSVPRDLEYLLSGYWSIEIDKFGVSSNADVSSGQHSALKQQTESTLKVFGKKMFAYVDTGTSAIGGGPALAQMINEELGYDEKDNSGRYLTKDCSRIKDTKMVFTIGGKDFALTKDVYNSQYGADDATVCYSEFEALFEDDESSGDLIILGDTFLREFYTIFDATDSSKPKVGFLHDKEMPTL